MVDACFGGVGVGAAAALVEALEGVGLGGGLGLTGGRHRW
jgi:hypothetical protein